MNDQMKQTTSKLNLGLTLRVCLILLFSMSLAFAITKGNIMSENQEAKISEEELKRIEGNYKVDVHPDPFGFFVKDGKLWLKIGGLEGSGQTVPLIYQGDGKFKITPDHANEFEFKVEGDKVKFTLYSMGNAIQGYRLEEKKPEAGEAAAQEPAKPPKREKSRADILAEIKQIEPEFKKNPGDKEIRFKYGNLLYQSGEFWKARDVIAPLAQAPNPSDEALSVAAKLEYLIGNYDEAENLYKRLVEAKAGNIAGQVMANVGLMFTYYQMDRFEKIKGLEFPPGFMLPNVEAIKTFEESPYQKQWHGEDKVSIIPFLMTDPLPLLEIEFNGVPVIVFFDTGADTLILDNEIASALGIEWDAKAMGKFGGGKTSEFGFGKIDSVKLGDVTLKQVPIIILPTKRFSKGFEDGKYTIGGGIGTAAMRQFLSTIDYKNGRMILRERTAENVRKLREELKGRIAAEVPFVLDATHLMMARGGLNDKDGLTFFVDSGLAGAACLAAPIQTLHYVGIPVPETKIDRESVGGGGGTWTSGVFPITTISMGSLTQSNLKGEYGSRPPESYWGSGYIQDGLISHRFLRQYSSWTLDFDAMKYIFEK